LYNIVIKCGVWVSFELHSNKKTSSETIKITPFETYLFFLQQLKLNLRRINHPNIAISNTILRFYLCDFNIGHMSFTTQKKTAIMCSDLSTCEFCLCDKDYDKNNKVNIFLIMK